MEMIHCPTSIDVNFKTTTFFTTVTNQIDTESNQCPFVNYDGLPHRMDICHREQIGDTTYSYRYHCSDTVPIYDYFVGTGHCDNEPIISMKVPNVLESQCNGQKTENLFISTTECKDYDYLQLKLFKTENGCSPDDLVSFDEDEMSSFSSFSVRDIVVEQCVLDGGSARSKMYHCNNNNDHLEHGYFTVDYYENTQCEGEPVRSTVTKEIDCIDDHIAHLIWCDGVNNVTYNMSQFVILDCNYFIDDFIGRPLDICADRVVDGVIESEMYQCNTLKTAIQRFRFEGSGCQEDMLLDVEVTEYEQFYCESEYSCDAIVGWKFDDDDSSETETDTEVDMNTDFDEADVRPIPKIKQQRLLTVC